MTRPVPPLRRLTRNAARCTHCGTVIESRYRRDAVRCSCGRIAVDGGLSYLRRAFTAPTDLEELAEYAD